ncbi:MAG: C25 family cysteine peptidase [Rudaea sp.]
MTFHSFRRIVPQILIALLLSTSLDAWACSGRLHIEVKNSGVYALDYAAIVAAQPALKGCRSDDLVLLNRGHEVPIRMIGDQNGSFGPGARIEWVGQALHGPSSWYDPYSTVNVYLLGANAGKHARMTERAAKPGANPAALQRSLHLEQENLMLRLSSTEMKPGDEPDVWQWTKLTPIDAKPFAVSFDAADLDTRSTNPAARLTLNFRGVSNIIPVKGKTKPPDHQVAVTLNGKPLQTLEWDGRAEFRQQVSVPRALLRARGNRLELRVPRRDVADNKTGFIVDVVMFNWMRVTYPIHGDLDVDASAFEADSDAPVVLDYRGRGTPALYGTDGVYRPMVAQRNGRYRAAGAKQDVQLYPFVAGHVPAPPHMRAVADADLRNPGDGYDYLIVAHPSLLGAVEPLARYHRAHGLHVDAIDVDAVYDQFNGGVAHPRAIRDLLAWATQHWKIKPRYLLLVGDASTEIHHDARNGRLSGASYLLTPDPPTTQILHGAGFSGMDSFAYAQSDNAVPTRNLIPTWQYPTSEGQAASDNGFVALKTGDFHPLLAVGRFPVVTPAQVSAIVDKTIGYMTDPAPGSWRRDVTFISTSEVASFKQASDNLAESLDQEGFATTSLYTDFNDRSREHYEQARTTLRKDLDAGNLLVHFLGHGGSYIWRVGPMGDLFSLDDVARLSNTGRYPMVLAMTCFSAPFDNPTDDSIGEKFLREAGKGAIAVFAASWKNSPNPTYSKILIDELLKPGHSIGDAIVAAKGKIADHDFVEMYNLLGDPAVVLARPKGKLRLQLAASRWDPKVLVQVPAYDFGGDVYVNWIGADGTTLQSHRYQARNTVFSLTPVPKATAVSVYATDSRDGLAAVGGLSLLPPPKPEAAVAKPKPLMHESAAKPVVRRTMQRSQPRDAHDHIATLDFDSASAPKQVQAHTDSSAAPTSDKTP